MSETPVDLGLSHHRGTSFGSRESRIGGVGSVRDEEGAEETYQIVGSEEADPEKGRISSASPLARALLGRRTGEKVHFQIPAAKRELTVLNVRYVSL